MPDPGSVDDYLAGLGIKPTGGATPVPAAGAQRPPNFTKEVPGSNGTAWYDPQSQYIWSPSTTNPQGFVTHASKVQVEQIMGAGGSPAGPTTPLPEIPANLAAQGFHRVPGTDLVINERAQSNSSRTNPQFGVIAYPNASGVWSTRPASPSDLTLAKGSPAPTAQPNAAPATPQSQPPTQTVPGAAVPGAPTSPYAQSESATRSLLTPGNKDTQQVTLPQNYQSGPAGLSRTLMPGGGTQDIGVAHRVDFSPYSPNSAPAPVTLDSGTTATMPAFQGPASAPGVGLFGLGDKLAGPGGEVSAAPAAAQLPAAGGQPLVVNGVILSPEVVAAIQQAWAGSPEAIPQALALAARESGGNPAADNSKGYQGGPLNNDPRFGNAPGSPYYNSIDYGLFGINDQNFARYGLTPEMARDPLRNAQAAYGLFQASNGFGPWSGNGTIPLPAAAQMPSGGTGPLGGALGGLTSGLPQPIRPVHEPGQLGTQPTPEPAYSGGQQQPAAPPTPSTSLYGQGQIWHLGDMSRGYNPVEILRGNGLKSSGDADTDAVLAARIIQQQVPGGGYGDPLASKSVGASGTFQSPLSGGLQNEVRTDSGYAFSPGNVNSGNSLRSPMGGYTPVMTPEGVVIRSANGIDQTPAAQAQAYQTAGFGQRDSGGTPYLMNPTSNPGAVIQAAQAAAANPSAPVGYASAANLPNEAQLLALGQALQDRNQGLGEYGSGAYGADGGTRFLASGGSFNTPNTFQLQRELLQLQREHPGYTPREQEAGRQNPWTPIGHATGFANGGEFVTTSPTLFPMAGGGQAVTSEYGQPELVSEHGSRVNVTPLQGYADGGAFNTGTTVYDDPGPQGERPTDQGNTGTPITPVADPSAISPTAYQGSLDTNPELGRQTELVRRQGARDNFSYLYRAAGVGQPIGIQSMNQPGALAPNQYWQPLDYTNQIQGLQARLAALGPTSGDPSTLQAQTQAEIQMALAGNGLPPGDPGYRAPDPVRAAQLQAALDNQLRGLNDSSTLMSQIANLRAAQSPLTAGTVPQPINPPDLSSPITPTPGKGLPTAPESQLAALHEQASTGQWTPRSSDSLVQLAQSLNAGNRDTVGPALMALTNTLKQSRAVPAGLNQGSYTNPVAMAAAAKFGNA